MPEQKGSKVSYYTGPGKESDFPKVKQSHFSSHYLLFLLQLRKEE